MIKKSHILSFFAVFLATSILFSAWATRLFSPDIGILAQTEGDERPVVVIDAGHGGIDGGATGTDGTLEKDLNLAVSQKLAALFALGGYTVVMTRTDDRSLAAPNAQKGHVKRSDLDARLKVLNQYPEGLFVSIHMNAYQGVPCQGLQVWYSEGAPSSAEYAAAVQAGVKALLQPENNRKIKAATSSIYLLRQASTPAILIECGFLSNEEECERLKCEAYQQSVALAIFASLHQKMQCNT